MKLVLGQEIYIQAAAFMVRYPVFVIEQGIAMEEEFDQVDQGQPLYAVIFDGHRPVATARFLHEDGETFRVTRVATAKDYRGQGLGRKAVEAIEAYGLDQGYRRSLIHADITAHPFYQALGYQICSDYYYEDGIKCANVEKVFQAE